MDFGSITALTFTNGLTSWITSAGTVLMSFNDTGIDKLPLYIRIF